MPAVDSRHLAAMLSSGKLSQLGGVTLRQIATPLLCGYSVTEIANATGTSISFVRSMLAELASEIEQNASKPQREIAPAGEPPS